jgi:carboxyl-terminal processing protease
MVRRLNFLCSLAGAAVIFLAAGAGAAQPDAAARPRSPFAELDLLAKALAYVQGNYVEEVDDARLVRGAVRGMLAGLDSHSRFLSPAELREWEQGDNGLPGIGLEVEAREQRLVVISPVPGSPAAAAGIRPGDSILRIDGRPTATMSPESARLGLRGPAGTAVTLSLLPRGEVQARDLTIVRRLDSAPVVESRRLDPGLGYVRVRRFSGGVAAALRQAVERFSAAGDGGLDGLVLDLRGNPGGLVDEATRTADLFLADGLIVRTVGRGGRVLKEERARRLGTFTGFPMVCLVDEGSASAAEIVAAALQDQRRAAVVGARSYGKGSVQSVIRFGDGSAIVLTVARYLTPSGRSIEGQGVVPEQTVAGDAAQLAAAVAWLQAAAGERQQPLTPDRRQNNIFW